VKTEVTSVGDNEVLLAVEIPHDDVRAKIERTIHRLNGETSFPGFRKGKAPREMIVKRYGDDFIHVQTLEDSIDEWYSAALEAAELTPVAQPEFEELEAPTGDGAFSFAAKVQVWPEAKLGEYKGLEVPKGAVEVKDAQVDMQLAMLQERLASLKPVEGRAVRDGDFVQIDFKGFADDRSLEGAAADDYMLQVGEGRLIPGFEEALVGLEVGGETTFDLTFPDDYPAEELRGKPVRFEASVKEIKEKVVPDLNDEFAAEVSEFDTLDELSADIALRLGAAQEQAVEREFRGRVVEEAVADATVSVPQAMVDRQAHALYHELEEAVGEQGMEMKDYLEVVAKTQEQIEDELRPRAEAVVKRGVVLAAVREAEGIEVDDDEVRDYLRREAELLKRDPTQHILESARGGRQDGIRDELVMVKTVDFLVEHAVAVDEPAGGEESGDDEAAGEAAAQESSVATENPVPRDEAPSH